MAKTTKTVKTAKVPAAKTAKMPAVKTSGQLPPNPFLTEARKLKSASALQALKSVKEDDLSFFLSSSVDQKAMLINQWEQEKKLDRPQTETLRNTTELLRVT